MQQEGTVPKPAGHPFRRVILVAASLSLVSLASPPAAAVAQILYGSVVGIVKDATGGLIPGALVTSVNKETNLTREATTNAEGSYSIINVLPGPYDLKVTLTGFRDVARPNVPITIGQIARVDFTLEIGTVAESVMVIGESPILQTDKADVHTSLRAAE